MKALRLEVSLLYVSMYSLYVLFTHTTVVKLTRLECRNWLFGSSIGRSDNGMGERFEQWLSGRAYRYRVMEYIFVSSPPVVGIYFVVQLLIAVVSPALFKMKLAKKQNVLYPDLQECSSFLCIGVHDEGVGIACTKLCCNE